MTKELDVLFSAMSNRTSDSPLCYIKVGNSKTKIACMYELLSRMYEFGFTIKSDSFENYINRIIHTVCYKGIDLFITINEDQYITACDGERVNSQHEDSGQSAVIFNVDDLVRACHDGKLNTGDTVTVREDLAALIDDKYDAATDNHIWYVDQDVVSEYSGRDATICYVHEPEGDVEIAYILMFDTEGNNVNKTIPPRMWTDRMFEQEDNFDTSKSCITNLYSA